MQQFDSHKDKSEVEGETGVEMRELWALDVHGDRLPEHSEAEEAPAPNTNPVLPP